MWNRVQILYMVIVPPRLPDQYEAVEEKVTRHSYM